MEGGILQASLPTVGSEPQSKFKMDICRGADLDRLPLLKLLVSSRTISLMMAS